jgi:hypothetical protein
MSAKQIERYKLLTREFLLEEYSRKGRSALDIAKSVGYSHSSFIHELLRRYEIPTHNDKLATKLTKTFLETEYVLKRKTIEEICREFKIKSPGCVGQALKKHGFILRSHNERSYATGQKHKAWTGCGEIPGSYWCSVKWAAKNRGLNVKVTIKQAWEIFLKQGRCCALSGEPICFQESGDVVNRTTKTASLDRIDSSKEYTVDNVQWIHKELQNMKFDKPDAEFVRWCKLVAKHNEGIT